MEELGIFENVKVLCAFMYIYIEGEVVIYRTIKFGFNDLVENWINHDGEMNQERFEQVLC